MWYALYTHPRCEKKVADALVRKQIATYCPLNRVVKQWSDRKKTIEEPLFKSYVFVNIEMTNSLPVLQTPGVLNFVYWLGKPAVIRDEEIDTIRKFLNDYENVQLEKTEVRVDDKVRILYGPFMDMEGDVSEVRNNTVKVQLPSLGYALTAQLDRTNVKVITGQPGTIIKKVSNWES